MGATINDVTHDSMRDLLGNVVHDNPGFSIDTNSNDVETDNAFSYTIASLMFSNAADAAIDISAEIADLPDDLADENTAIYVFSIDDAGAYTVQAGVAVSNADIADGSKLAAWPEPIDGSVAFGAVKVKNATGSAFVLGTTAFDAAGVTDTFYNLNGRIPSNF